MLKAKKIINSEVFCKVLLSLGVGRDFNDYIYSKLLTCPFTFLPDNTKIRAFCVFRLENEWTLLNRTLQMFMSVWLQRCDISDDSGAHEPGADGRTEGDCQEEGGQDSQVRVLSLQRRREDHQTVSFNTRNTTDTATAEPNPG